MRKTEQDKKYQQRLNTFLGQIKQVEQNKRREELHEIMDTAIFRDLETALMMATTYDGGRRA